MSEPSNASSRASWTLGVLGETAPGERRVAADPDVVAAWRRSGIDVLIEMGAGISAAFSDADYVKAGATIATRDDVVAGANVIAVVRSPSEVLVREMRSSQVLIGLIEPREIAPLISLLCERGVTVVSFTQLPRTLSRAQSMDALTSQSSAAGYRAAIVAAEAFGGFFPMMITAAGTARPARILVIGAGVAGLQALGTARRLGALVTGYDVRAVSREEVESVGAVFATSSVAEGTGTGGYAQTTTAAQLAIQQEELTALIARFDVIITTAKVPGGPPPLLVPEDALASLAHGSVCVDLASGADGGNVFGSIEGERVTTSNGVTVIGAGELAAGIPSAASRMYARNVQALVAAVIRDGSLAFDPADEVQRDVVLTHHGKVVSQAMQTARDHLTSSQDTASAPEDSTPGAVKDVVTP